MRENDPVRYDEVRQCWDVFRYNDIQSILSDYETFSSQGSFGAGGSGGIIDLSETMINRDPPEHERLRGVADEFFEPEYLRQYSNTFVESADQQLDRVLANGNEFDFAAEFSAPIPAYVIGELLGIPPEKRDLLLGVRPGAQEGTQGALKQYITQLVEERTENPGEDVLSQIIHANPEGRPMTPEEIYNFCSLLLLAGSHTTITLLTNFIWMVVENDHVSDIRSGKIDINTAIEETLRFQPSVHTLIRTAAEDTEVRGQSVQEGESVVLWLGSANRDPDRFDDPETFDPNRRPNPHMAFGRGIHTCLGAPLARLEARAVLPVFFDRITDIQFTTDERIPIMQPFLYGLQTLPVSVST